MDMKLELVAVPVTDVDRAKEFYVRVGFVADHDHTVSEEVRFVQLTPPGSGCSIAIGRGLTEMAPGRSTTCRWWWPTRRPRTPSCASAASEAEGVTDLPWGRFVFFSDPDGNRWSLQELPDYAANAGG